MAHANTLQHRGGKNFIAYQKTLIILQKLYSFFFQAWTFLPLPEEENEVIPPHF